MTAVVARGLALAYLRRSWAPIPVPYSTKNPNRPGWQTLRPTEDDLPALFPADPLNVGVLLGDPSNGLADVDLDVLLAILLADRFLPRTGAAFGRASARRAHRLYRVLGNLKTRRWRDPTVPASDERATLLEVRWTGAQTVFPGSTHPSGEAIEWDEDGDPAEVDAVDLLTALGKLAAAVLLARHWPGTGSRHDAALALAGGLVRAGWTETAVAAFVEAVALAAGDDEAEDRAAAAVSTAKAASAGRPTTGWPTLSRLTDPRVVASVLEWLAIRAGGGDDTGSPSVRDEEFSSSTPPDPHRLACALPVPPFPVEVFPPLIRGWLEDGASALGCPVDLIAVPFLAYAASVIGRTRRVVVKATFVHLPIVWTAVVAPSGSAKSPADAYARAPLLRLQAEAHTRYTAQLMEYRREKMRWSLADPTTRGEEPAKPRYEHWYTTDATVEAVAPMLLASPGIAAAHDELVGWIRGCGAYKKGGGPDRQKYLELWNGSTLKVDRKHQDVLFVTDPVLCIAGGIQPERLPELNREASMHDGMLPRFLWTYHDLAAPPWTWDVPAAGALEEVVGVLQVLRRTPVEELRRTVLHPESRPIWAAWFDANGREAAGLPPLARAFASKLSVHLARLSFVLHCLWNPDDPARMLSPERMEGGVRLVGYFRAHARRVLVHFGTHVPGLDPELVARVRQILEQAFPDWLTTTELHRELSNNVAGDRLEAVLHALAADGVAEWKEEGGATNKRTLWRHLRANNSSRTDESPPTGGTDAGASSSDSYEEFRSQSATDPRGDTDGTTTGGFDEEVF